MKYDSPNNRVQMYRIRLPIRNYVEPEFKAKVNGIDCPATDTEVHITTRPPNFIDQNHFTGKYYSVMISKDK